MIESMFHLQLPILEKILRPVIVYLCLIVFLRIFGKRELAQLNPFDLVVLLCLSNTVQNSIIGDDNSVSGGVIGVLSLLTINWLLTRVLYRMPKLDEALASKATVLIRHGVVDWDAMKEEALTEVELRSVLHKQGFTDPAEVELRSVLHKQGYNDPAEVEKCVLEPNGNFYIEGIKALSDDAQRAELMREIKSLAFEVKELKGMLAARE